MAQAQTKLTTWQAACIITGYGVGSGRARKRCRHTSPRGLVG